MANATWNNLAVMRTTPTTGYWESPVLDYSAVERISSSVITWDEVDAPNTTAILEAAISYDEGATWTTWALCTNGESIPRITENTFATSKRLKLRVDQTVTAYKLDTPIINNIHVHILSAYLDFTWVSEELDLSLQDTDPANSWFTWVADLHGGTVTGYIRHKTAIDGVWTPYEALTDGWANTGEISQFKLDARPSVYYPSTPLTISSADIKAVPLHKSGHFMTQMVDISQVQDKSTGKLVLSSDLTGGRVFIWTRTAATAAGTPSAWEATLSDGTIVSPENNFIQAYIWMTGDTGYVDDLTVTFDGEAAVVAILTGQFVGADYSFTTLKDVLIIADGHDVPRKWDGVNPTELLGGSPPVLDCVITHQNRVWGVDANNASRIRFSDILDPETWSVLNFMDFNPEDGDKITCLSKNGQDLVVSKRWSMALLTGNSTANYAISWLDTEQGATGRRSAANANKYFCYVSQDGIRFTDFNTSALATERLIPDWEHINKRRLNQAAMVYWHSYLLVAMPENNSLYNNTVWMYDFLRNAWLIIQGWNVAAWSVFEQYGEDVLLACDSMTGQVYEVMLASTYDDTVPVEYDVRLRDFTFDAPERYKLFRTINLDLESAVEESTLEVDLIVDSEVMGTYTTVIPAGNKVKYQRMILPPLYGAVLGRSLSLEFRGRVGIQSVAITFSYGGVVPDGGMG